MKPVPALQDKFTFYTKRRVDFVALLTKNKLIMDKMYAALYSVDIETGFIKAEALEMAKKLTISEIAEKAGVSKATVSRVLNSSDSVNTETDRKSTRVNSSH